MTDSSAGRRWARAGRWLAVAALAYFAGVGIGYALGRPDPWGGGIIAPIVAVGSAAGGALIRRRGAGHPD
ncbi:hypothetical protein Q5425_11585 [Amycolatopsis sp. A133]|uniref:hypothetical protein n=1 Tax=Amycolatopsis sp. A133 TaxID=3064472 RepID=UPI0027FA3289|nr:hypothetical protein [Amycolatopsis sp. A133]MDQ7804378.1 hypothetical protein [Amycolatopsis sp. A133]